MKILNVGIIGYGLSGRIFHGAVIRKTSGYLIKKIVTTNEEKKREAAADIKGVEVVDSALAVFEDPTIDVVVISTPNTTHFDLARQALLSGKHVVIEKPFTVDVKEAAELISISEKMGLLLSVYHNRRFDSDFRTVKKLIEKNAFGRLVEFESHFDRFRPEIKLNAWKEEALPGSGILFDLGSHLIDQALSLFGLPNEVYADFTNQRGGSVEDQFEVILYYDSLKVTLKSGSLVHASLPRFLLLGTEGSFIKYGLDVQEPELRSGNQEPWGIEPKSQWGVYRTIGHEEIVKSEVGDYRLFYDNLHRAVTSSEELIVKGIDGYNVIKIIEAAKKSNLEKRRIAF